MKQQLPSKVLVTGASGRTGREILRGLVDTPVDVRAVTRSADNYDSLVAAGADEVVVVDLLNPADARTALEHCDAVLFAAGSSLATGLTRPWRVVDGNGVRNLIDAAVDEGVGTFVLQSSIGVGTSRLGMPLWARLFALRWAVREKGRAERALRDSGLEYVILRPGWLTDDPETGDVVVAEGSTRMTGAIPRADVARLMIAALYTPATSNRTFEVVARSSAEDVAPETLTDIEWGRPADSVVLSSDV